MELKLALKSGLIMAGVKDVVLGHGRRWGQTRGNQEMEKDLDSMKAVVISS